MISHRAFAALTIAAVLAALLLRLAFVAASLKNLPPTSDEANAVLMARRIAEGERPLLIGGQPYQFPADAYLLSLLAHRMAPNAWGARYLGILQGLLFPVGLVLVALRLYGWRTAWPAALLILFPSAYWLMVQVGTAMPGHPLIGTLSWIMLLAIAISRQSRRPMLWLLAAGAAGGFACSTHMLVLPLFAAAAVVACAGRSWRASLGYMVAFATGAALGLVPHWLAGLTIEGANQAVLGTYRFRQALGRLWSTTLAWTLPGALGVNPTLFPDFQMNLEWGQTARWPMVALFLAALMAVTVHRLVEFLRRLRHDRWPSLELHDAFPAATLLALALFAFSRRGNTECYRYLLAAAWATPFLIGYLYTVASRPWKKWLGVLAVALALFNAVTSLRLVDAWHRPGVVAQAADTPDITGLIRDLKNAGIHHCYATMWLAYRITYESDEAILCSPPYNERFFDWPLPYKERVDRETNIVFVLSDSVGSRLTATQFEKDLQRFGIETARWTSGPFRIYGSFRHVPSARDRTLPPSAYRVSVTHNPRALWALRDGNHRSAWLSRQLQEAGMAVLVELPTPQRLHRITLHYTANRLDRAAALRVEVRQDGKWVTVTNRWPEHLDRLRFVEDRPRYGDVQHTLWFDPILTDALRIEIADPKVGRWWSITELEVGAVNSEV